VGLSQTLKQAVAEWSSTFEIPVEFSASGNNVGRLPSAIETHVFRIAQEALNNVHKHAGASKVVVRIDRTAHETRLEIADNGIGFDPSAPRQAPKGRGLGVLGMRERAALIGGELHVVSRPGKGTSIRLVLPH
jgi:two-component system sensor histidine kinase DegS